MDNPFDVILEELKKAFMKTGVDKAEKNFYKKASPEIAHRVKVRALNCDSEIGLGSSGIEIQTTSK